MKGFGTVVTGTLISGAVKAEDEVELLPLAQSAARARTAFRRREDRARGGGPTHGV